MIPTMLEKEGAMSIVQMLFSYGFESALGYIDDGTTYWDWSHCPENIKMLHEKGLNVTCGASKVCIYTDDDEDRWVIKIGFCFDHNKLKSIDYHIDFCELEANYYDMAINEGCATHFAATYLCGEIDGIKIFLQEKVETQQDIFEDRIYNYVSDFYADADCDDEDEVNDYIQGYIDDECTSEDYIMAILGDTPDSRKLLNFVEKNDINDLHELNWGVAYDGRIVLIDFSGYR